MQFIWIQQWTALPVIVEDSEMNEGNVSGGRLLLGQQGVDPSTQPKLSEKETYPVSAHGPRGSVPYDFHLQGATPQQHAHNGQLVNLQGQYAPTNVMGQSPSGGAFNMVSMFGALPEQQSKELQRLSSVHSAVPTGYPAQQISQFAGQATTNNQGYGSYQPQYSTQFQQIAAAQAYPQAASSHQPHSGGPNSVQPSYGGQQYFPVQNQQPYMYYPGQYGHVGGPHQGMQINSGPYPSSYNRSPGFAYGQGALPQSEGDLNAVNGRYPSYGSFMPGSSTHYGYHSAGPLLRPGSVPAVSRGSSGSSTAAIPSSPRGPPRKPKQSGYALWVGNLPSGAIVSDLKDHFSRDATKTIESVFLISKSNCAFVNYRTETACAAAMARFHDSRFQGIRLVCRLRRSSAAPSPGIPTGPAALMPVVAQSQTAVEAIAQNREISSRAEELAQAGMLREGGATKIVDKYFVMKSLTVEDMELSVRNSIWATQSHNEDALNKSFETAENVYLIFSANKSGEYFGYARMASAINEEAAATLDWTPRAEAVADDPDLPRSIPTPATEFAPKGRIIDDSARGTIFWEADTEDGDNGPTMDGELEEDGATKDAEGAETEAEAEDAAALSETQSFGKPFKIEWLSTNRLPFYRTRGLRNPWNANREVKIARDGTELETSVGKRLIQMFQKSTATPGASARLPSIPGRPY